VKALVTILLCLSLSGCAFIKDAIGGKADIPAGFVITHECVFLHPVQAWVVGFRVMSTDGKSDTCGQVMIPSDEAVPMAKKELIEHVFRQFMAGMFTPCKE